MAFDRFLIAPLNSGLQTNLKSWQIPEDAFETLQNAYVFRGRVKKRFGTVLMGSVNQSRFRVQVGTIGAPVSPVPGNVFAVGQSFTAGTQIFTVITPGVAQPMLATGPGTGTFSTTNGAFTLAGTGLPAGTPIFWYPGLPVMGLTQYESGAINNHPSYGFDTQFAYVFVPTVGWARSGIAIWHGTDFNYFWATNWYGIDTSIPVMYVTNFFVVNYNGAGNANDDPIWRFDGTTWTPISPIPVLANAFYFNPAPGDPPVPLPKYTGPYVKTARIVLPFKNRLILLNTVENDNPAGNGVGGTNTNFKNRCRYSANGSPLARNAWYEPNQSDSSPQVLPFDNVAIGAGFIDATTEEAIISAEFIRDRLIVYFERSTWELAYTGNEILPFVWQKINTELGSQATFSTVPFDTQVLTIGNTGVHSCSGTQVERIDQKIPDEIFTFKVENNEQLRTAGVRDYFEEMVYWAYVADNDTQFQNYPNKILVYNYRNNTWSINDDCFTAFGYFEQQVDTTWNSTTLTWQEATFQWNSGLIQAQQRQILAGTPEGFVLIIQPDVTRNAPSMQITNMTIPSAFAGVGYVDLEVINHNLVLGDYVAIENAVGIIATNVIYEVFAVIDKDNITLADTFPVNTIQGTYVGAGTLARVSNIQILSKRWNPYVDKDKNLYLQRIDFGVQKTSDGELTVDYYPSSSFLSMVQAGDTTGSIMGNNVLETSPYALYPLESFQDLLWHPIYFQASGQFIQIFMYFSPAQIADTDIAWSDFELEGLCLYTQPTSYRLE